MYRLSLRVAAVGVALSLSAGAASAATTIVLNFDDLTGTGPMPATYEGVNFQDFSYYDNPRLPEYPTKSGRTSLYANYAKHRPGEASTSIFTFDEPARFDGAWFSGGLAVVFDLFLDGQRVHTTGSLSLNDTMQYLASGYGGLVDEVRLYGNSGNWVMDDLTYTTGVTDPMGVPEPATWALMILGFGAAGVALRARRRLAAVA